MRSPTLREALRATPPRSVQVIAHCLLQHQPVPDCAAFYGIGEDAFLALLGRSLAQLARQQGLAGAESAALSLDAPRRLRRVLDRLSPAGPPVADEALVHPPAGDDELERLVAALWRAGPREMAPAAPPSDPEPGWRTALRWALIGAAVVALLWFSKGL